MGTAQQMLIYGSAAAGATDPYWSNVVLLCHFDGADGSTTLTDSTGRHDPITDNNGIAISTAQFKFGTASLKSTGGSQSATAGNLNGDFTFGTGEWCIECWTRPSTGAVTADNSIIDLRPSSTNGAYPSILCSSSAQVALIVNSTVQIISGSGAWLADTWQHIACARVSGSTRLFIDGTQVGSTWTDSTTYGAGIPRLMQNSFGVNPMVGYMDEVRITKGVGRYSSNFTAPTTAFPNS